MTMNAERRSELAAHARHALPMARAAVVDSWKDLIPAAASWRPEVIERGRIASNAAVEGLVGLLEHGDLDDQTWHAIRQVVLPHGYLVASELLRAVVIVGVQVLAEELTRSSGLTQDERWQLQQEASAFCRSLLGEQEEPDATAYDALLAELERAGPDIA
jgi:hypothetical protein